MSLSPSMGKLTAAHKRYIKLRDEADQEITRLQAKIEKARQKLVENCVHPRELVTEYTWEWDNGYGRQKMQPGLLCTICKARCSWPSSSTLWTALEHQGRRDDY